MGKRNSLDAEVFAMASEYFGVAPETLSRRTRIAVLERNLHDGVQFSFDIEKHFGIQFSDEEDQALRSLGDYIRHIAASRDTQTTALVSQWSEHFEHHKAA